MWTARASVCARSLPRTQRVGLTQSQINENGLEMLGKTHGPRLRILRAFDQVLTHLNQHVWQATLTAMVLDRVPDVFSCIVGLVIPNAKIRFRA